MSLGGGERGRTSSHAWAGGALSHDWANLSWINTPRLVHITSVCLCDDVTSTRGCFADGCATLRLCATGAVAPGATGAVPPDHDVNLHGNFSCKLVTLHTCCAAATCREERKRRRAKKKRTHKAKETAKEAEAAARAAASGDATALAGRKSLAKQLAAATSSGLIKKGVVGDAAGGKSDYGKSTTVFGKLAEQQAAGKAGKERKQSSSKEGQQLKGSMLKL